MAVSPSVERPLKPAPSREAIPPLVDGERLTRDEFERRYDAMPGLKKAELIEGVVHMPSPVRHGQHSNPHSRLVGWLWVYRAGTPGVDSGDNGSIRLDLSNMPQPDGFLIIRPEHGGRVRISEDDYIEGGPELVAEVSASTAGYDLGEKQGAYLRNGVLEYIVWRVLDRAIDWFVRRDERYERLEPGADGILRSEVFPGLWLDPAAMTAATRPGSWPWSSRASARRSMPSSSTISTPGHTKVLDAPPQRARWFDGANSIPVIPEGPGPMSATGPEPPRNGNATEPSRPVGPFRQSMVVCARGTRRPSGPATKSCKKFRACVSSNHRRICWLLHVHSNGWA